jgi:hypothetical protein
MACYTYTKTLEFYFRAIAAVLTGLLFKSAGYYIVLIYFSFALGFFQVGLIFSFILAIQNHSRAPMDMRLIF